MPSRHRPPVICCIAAKGKCSAAEKVVCWSRLGSCSKVIHAASPVMSQPLEVILLQEAHVLHGLVDDAAEGGGRMISCEYNWFPPRGALPCTRVLCDHESVLNLK